MKLIVSTSAAERLLTEDDLTPLGKKLFLAFKKEIQSYKPVSIDIVDDEDGSIENDLWLFRANLPKSERHLELDDLNDVVKAIGDDCTLTIGMSKQGGFYLQASYL